MDVREREWLWGWDPTPGIVSVWADARGQCLVWRRDPVTEALSLERVRFRPWLLLASLRDLGHLGARLLPESAAPLPDTVAYRELAGPGELRFLVHADDGRALHDAVLRGARRRLGRSLAHVRELGDGEVLALPPEEQYLVQSGRCYFRELSFDQLRRLQFDLETTGLDPERDRIFLVALHHAAGSETLEADGDDDDAEARLIEALCARIRALDPDVIENHNLHGFDLPFLAHRAERLGVSLALGRSEPLAPSRRPAARGARLGFASAERAERMRRSRYTLVGRELVDTMDAVRRHDFAARDLPGHGLKAVARHFGIADVDRELVPGALVHRTYLEAPERVRKYARQDVEEAGALARVLGGAAFALARMVPRRYERLADTGAATGMIDPLLVRAYLRAGEALPAHRASDGTAHSGAALYLFATGVAHRVVKADVASLYPSLMREYRIGPARDRLGVFLALVDNWVELRLSAKQRAKTAPAHSPEQHTAQAISAALKLVVNSAYGYLGAASLTRFSDVHAANLVTRHGRELLAFMCNELAKRGVTLLEADTDGVYFAVPATFTEADEQRVVAEVAALLPRRVALELEGRYAAMLSHEPKNYALLAYDGALSLRGVAFRSRRAEPFGEQFLRRALAHLLRDDLEGVRTSYLDTVAALAQRQLPASAVASHVRLSKQPAEYLASRGQRRELAYEALLASGRADWSVGERVHVYRAVHKRAALLEPASADARDYDVDYYLRLLRETFAARLARAMSAEDFAAVFADPTQLSLFAPSLRDARPILTVSSNAIVVEEATDDRA